MGHIEQVAVVIPVHNEEQHLDRALAGVRAAADLLQRRQPGTGVRILVVLDSCTDNSSALVARFAVADRRFTVLEVSYRCVGESRRAGIRALRGDGSSGDQYGPASRLWLANTDADSCVPANWLLRQVMLADAGADAVLGTVEPDPHGMDPELLRRWHAKHSFEEDHPHVYGANFGVRASAYFLAGGFPGQRSHEDRTLVERLRRRGFSVTSTDSIRVLTSGRTQARAPQGFGAYLLALGREPAVALEG
jgi:glycosyltransferase involved in cell wall biosynthesis